MKMFANLSRFIYHSEPPQPSAAPFDDGLTEIARLIARERSDQGRRASRRDHHRYRARAEGRGRDAAVYVRCYRRGDRRSRTTSGIGATGLAAVQTTLPKSGEGLKAKGK